MLATQPAALPRTQHTGTGTPDRLTPLQFGTRSCARCANPAKDVDGARSDNGCAAAPNDARKKALLATMSGCTTCCSRRNLIPISLLAEVRGPHNIDFEFCCRRPPHHHFRFGIAPVDNSGRYFPLSTSRPRNLALFPGNHEHSTKTRTPACWLTACRWSACRWSACRWQICRWTVCQLSACPPLTWKPSPCQPLLCPQRLSPYPQQPCPPRLCLRLFSVRRREAPLALGLAGCRSGTKFRRFSCSRPTILRRQSHCRPFSDSRTRHCCPEENMHRRHCSFLEFSRVFAASPLLRAHQKPQRGLRSKLLLQKLASLSPRILCLGDNDIMGRSPQR